MTDTAKDLSEEPDLATQLLKDDAFISDMCRYSESLLTEKFIRQKYGKLDEATWTQLGESTELVLAIETESIRRTRNGQCAREKAQLHFTKMPDILNNIATNDSASPRHRIEAAREIRATAATGPEAAPADTSRFLIQINLGADTQLRWNKSIKPNPHDIEPLEEIEDEPPLLALMASNKSTDGGGNGNTI
jgi:hypothetical protein